jgi:CRP-like cAMP-binding protein
LATSSQPVNPGVLNNTELFKGLSTLEYERILHLARKKRITGGEFYFMEGDPATAIFLLVEGKVKLLQVTPQGQQVNHGYVSKGDVFGVISSLSEKSYPVSAQAIETCLALTWSQGDFNRLVENSPRIASNITHILAQKIQIYQDRIREMATQRVERRIARTLLRLAQQAGRKTESGVLIDIPLTRQDLAEMTGTTMFTVSRTLKQWETRGLIFSKREKVIIRFPHGLVTIAEDFGKEEPSFIAPGQRTDGR